MRILLDECVDWRLSRAIVGNETKAARQMGWATISNGELLALAAETFDVFITVDRNLSFQQNLSAVDIGVIVLHCPSNRLADLLELVPKLLLSIPMARAGTVTHFGA